MWYALLGQLAVAVSVAFTDSLLSLRAWFRRLTGVPRWVHPAIGGAVAGGMAVVAPALTGNMTAMAVFCVLKLAATVSSHSKRWLRGIFAPALCMGAMLGYLDVIVFHYPADAIGAFAVVGMGAVFAGIVRAL